MIKLLAPAKINLYLHITGRRDDGYHCIDSLFAFTKFGDQITLAPAPSLSLTIDGPFQSGLDTVLENNLIYRAATLLKNNYAVSGGAHIHLSKNIPIAAGLGGGSSDAATVLKGLNQLWDLAINDATLAKIGLSLGADIPACVYQKPICVSGIGEVIEPTSIPYPPSHTLLIKPPESLSTPAVFKQFAQLKLSFSSPAKKAVASTWSHFVAQLQQNQNDLEAPAISLMPKIDTLLSKIKEQPGCVLARMSGSGSACFAIFNDEKQLQLAKETLNHHFPDYWMAATKIVWMPSPIPRK